MTARYERHQSAARAGERAGRRGRGHHGGMEDRPLDVLRRWEGSGGTWQSVVLVDSNADNPTRRVRLSFVAG